VKSLRNGKASLSEAYAAIRGGEMYLHNLDIPEYPQRGYANHEPKRKRKLLLHRNEIDRLIGKMQERGLAVVPLRLYFRKGIAKVELALGRGRKLHDKREKMKKRSADREIRRMTTR
jgi:SsrA-binding protein